MNSPNTQNIADDLLLFFETKDSTFFDKFYHSLFPLAFKVSALITKNSADAEDVAQTAFYTVFNKIETCQAIKDKDNEKVKSWFLSIVYNQSKLVVRTRVRSKKKEQNQYTNKQPNESKNHMSKRLEDQMKKAIDSLDEKYRTPIILKYNEGLKSSEIAGILNVNEETLRVRIRRGLEKVKNLLAHEKSEFEKLLPSISIIQFDIISNVPPTPQFLNKKLIKSNLIANKSSSSITKIIFTLTAIIVLSVAVYFIYQNKINQSPVESSIKPILMVPSNSVTLNAKEWDLTKGNINGIIVKKGNWDFVNDGMVTTDMKEPDATLIVLPIKPTKYFKIVFTGKLEFGKNMNSIPFATKGVFLKNNIIMDQEIAYSKWINGTLDPKNSKFEFGLWRYPFQSTLYFTKNHISNRIRENPIGSIVSIIENENYEDLGLFVRDFKTQKIEYIPLTDNEIKEIEAEIATLLNTKPE